MDFQDLLILTFGNCSDNCGYLNPLSIKQIKKSTISGHPRKVKKHIPFVLNIEGTPNVIFLKLFFSHSFGIFKLKFVSIQFKFQIIKDLDNLLI